MKKRIRLYIVLGVAASLASLFLVMIIFSPLYSMISLFQDIKSIFICKDDNCSFISDMIDNDEKKFYQKILNVNTNIKKEGIVNPDIALFTATIITTTNYDPNFEYLKLTEGNLQDLISNQFLKEVILYCSEDTTPDNKALLDIDNKVAMADNNIAYILAMEEGLEEEHINIVEVPCTGRESCSCPPNYVENNDSITYTKNDDYYKQYLRDVFFVSSLSESLIPEDEEEKNTLFDKIIDDIYKLRTDLLEQVGTGIDLSFFALPIAGNKCIVTSPFGPRIDPLNPASQQITYHSGIDIVELVTDPDIMAVGDGKVTEVRDNVPWIDYNIGCGNRVYIEHTINGQKYESVYCHLKHNSVLVNAGDVVEKGQKIGTMGTTGASTGVHLHFMVRIGGNPVDPVELFRGRCLGLNL